ncbi:MAG: PepSY domain-containing protein [Caldicoprobacterales bacterium]|jgi:uncharacterized membrane protein YkoI
MREEQILKSLKNTIEQAPIGILDKIKEEPRTKMLAHDDITRQDTRTVPPKKLMSFAAAAAVLLFMFFGWQYQIRMPDSRVYLDVNPSIEIVTNRQDKVIELKAYNGDSNKLAEDLEYKGKSIYQVTEEILDRMMYESYLNKEHKFLLLSVYNKNQDKAEQQKQVLGKRIHDHLQAKELQPIILSQKLDTTSTIESYAKEYGISVSRMTFIRNLIILNPELQTEDLVGLSIKELVKLSQGMELELEKIIDFTDLDSYQAPLPESEYKESRQSPIISPAEARSIALSIANGTITDFEFDEDDLEYEVEIKMGDLEYEITIDARTGKVIGVETCD